MGRIRLSEKTKGTLQAYSLPAIPLVILLIAVLIGMDTATRIWTGVLLFVFIPLAGFLVYKRLLQMQE